MAKKKKWSLKPIKIDIELLKANIEIMLADIPKKRDRTKLHRIGSYGQILPDNGIGKSDIPDELKK